MFILTFLSGSLGLEGLYNRSDFCFNLSEGVLLERLLGGSVVIGIL